MRLIDADKLGKSLNDWGYTAAPYDYGQGNLIEYETIKESIKLLDEQPTVNPLQEVLDDIEALKKSPWFNDDKETNRVFYNIRKDAVEIIEEAIIKDIMKKYE